MSTTVIVRPTRQFHAACKAPWLRSFAAFCFAVCVAAAQDASAAVRELASPNEQADGLFGYTVSSFPDLNGDSVAEAVVGTHLETVSGVNHAGRVYIFSGATGAVLRQFQSPAPQTQGLFGSSLAVLDDVTGDGFPELAIGEDIDPGVFSGSGKVYIFNVATSTIVRTLQSPAPEATGRFGYTIAAMDDANNDGKGDLAVGAWGEDAGAFDAGRIYIFSGGDGTLLHTVASPNPVADGHFGFSLAGIADTNGDGRGDLIAGSPREDGGPTGSGRAYIISGMTGGILQSLLSPNAESVGRMGVSVNSIADLTGDGIEEAIVGAHFEDGGAVDAGRVHVFNGATGVPIRSLSIPNAPADSRLGWAVASVSDVDGDAKSDILATGVLEDVTFEQQGRVHLFSGATGAQLLAIDSPNPDIMGAFGFSVAGMPDINGDAVGDAVFGAHLEDPPTHPNDCGRAYIFTLAVPTATPGPPQIVRQPVNQDANIGDNVAFHVEAAGVGPFTYQWQRAGANVNGPQTDDLSITNVQLFDHTTVQVFVSSPWGTTPSDLVTLSVHSPDEPNSAQFIDATLPAKMIAGEALWIGITMRNNSQISWGLEQGYSLGVVEDNANFLSGATRVPLDPPEDIVVRNSAYQFRAFMQAPTTPGDYVVKFRMVEEFVEFFGDTATLVIGVIPGPNASADWSIYE